MDKLNTLPFFARFLESQELEQVQAGATSKTKDMVHTMKFPSDSDETTKLTDTVHTMKFPSDGDELGGI